MVVIVVPVAVAAVAVAGAMVVPVVLVVDMGVEPDALGWLRGWLRHGDHLGRRRRA